MTFVVDIVTGASQGIGRAIAESIAFHRSVKLANASTPSPYSLVLVGRNLERGNKAPDSIQKAMDGNVVCFEACDLSEYSNVVALRNRIHERVRSEGENGFKVGVLVNNAAECPKRQELVQRTRVLGDSGDKAMEDIDKQFATNILGYHFMLKVFSDNFSSQIALSDNDQVARPTHVVNVASNWAGNLDLNDLHFERRPYDNDSAYRQSKQTDRMLSKVWSEKLKDVAVVNSCHPGDPCTTLSKALGYNMWSASPSRNMIETQSPIPFLCGFSNPVETTGGWFDGRSENPSRCQFARMNKVAEQLFDVCESFARPQ